jgi:hypothetical protein
MRLYSLMGASEINDPQFGQFKVGPNGEFELPGPLSDRLHSFHSQGRRAWEDDAERQLRLASAELERLRDPATLAATMREMAENQQVMAAAILAAQQAQAVPVAVAAEPEVPVAPVAKRRGRAAAASAPAE